MFEQVKMPFGSGNFTRNWWRDGVGEGEEMEWLADNMLIKVDNMDIPQKFGEIHAIHTLYDENRPDIRVAEVIFIR